MSDVATDPIKFVTEADAGSDLEVKHMVTVAAKPIESGFELHIRVGTDEVPHPSEPAHWINWLDVRVGENSIARFDLTHLVMPNIKCNVALDAGTELTVISSCNIHGLWGRKFTL